MPFDISLDDVALYNNSVFIGLDNQLSHADSLLKEGKKQEAIDALKQIQIPKDAFSNHDGLECLAKTYHRLFEECGSYLGK